MPSEKLTEAGLFVDVPPQQVPLHFALCHSRSFRNDAIMILCLSQSLVCYDYDVSLYMFAMRLASALPLDRIGSTPGVLTVPHLLGVETGMCTCFRILTSKSRCFAKVFKPVGNFSIAQSSWNRDQLEVDKGIHSSKVYQGISRFTVMRYIKVCRHAIALC